MIQNPKETAPTEVKTTKSRIKKHIKQIKILKPNLKMLFVLLNLGNE